MKTTTAVTYAMPSLPDRISQPDLWRIRLRMRGVLRPAGGFCAPQQSSGRGDAGGDRAFSWGPETVNRARLRQPEIGETALSVEEIAHARHIGEIA